MAGEIGLIRMEQGATAMTVPTSCFIDIEDGGYVKVPVVADTSSANLANFGVSVLNVDSSAPTTFTLDAPAMSIQTEAKNLTILAIDITLKAEIPLFDAPAEGQPNDGKGTPGTADPAGYPLVQEINAESMESGDNGGSVVVRPYVVNGERDL